MATLWKTCERNCINQTTKFAFVCSEKRNQLATLITLAIRSSQKSNKMSQ